MIKAIFKYFAIAYVILGTLFLFRFYKDDIAITALIIVIVIVVLLVLGLFFGLVISVIAKRPAREKVFYISGQLISLSVLSLLFMFMVFHGARRKTNEEANESVIGPTTQTPGGYCIRLAFDSLKMKFKNPDDFRLNSYTLFEPGNHEKTGEDSTFTVYFEYTLKGYDEKPLYSKYIVRRNYAQLVQFNITTRLSDESQHLKHVVDSYTDTLKKYQKPR